MGRTDTIAAIATAAGRGAVGIVRLSGARAFDIATRMAGSLPPARSAEEVRRRQPVRAAAACLPTSG